MLSNFFHLPLHDISWIILLKKAVLGGVIWLRRSHLRQKCMKQKLLKIVDLLMVSEKIFEKLFLRIFEEKFFDYLSWKRGSQEC